MMGHRDSVMIAVGTLGLVVMIAHGYMSALWVTLYNASHATNFTVQSAGAPTTQSTVSGAVGTPAAGLIK